MQLQARHVEPAAIGEEHVRNVPTAAGDDSGNKAKGVLSKVKRKVRKLQNKMKMVTHSGNKHKDKDVPANSSSDAYETDDNSDDDAQIKYEQLRSISALDMQDDESGVEPSASSPGGAYWKSNHDSSPVSIFKSGGPSNTLQASPTEYYNYAATGNADKDYEGSLSKAQEVESPGDVQLNPIPDRQRNPATRDQIGVFREDLSTDRKLGVGHDDVDRADMGGEDRTSAAQGSSSVLANGSPPPSPVDGASEQMYRPVREKDNFEHSLAPASINASLYGDVLAAEEKLKSKETSGAQTGDVENVSDRSEEFSFNKENLSERRRDKLESDVVGGAAGDENDGDRVTNPEGWGKWSADKLYNAVDDLALKVDGGSGDAAEKRSLQTAKSDVDYFDPSNADADKFVEQLVACRGENGDDEEDAFLDGALAASAAIVEKLHEVKDSIASTFTGYGGASPSDGAAHRDGDERLSGRGDISQLEIAKDEDDEQQQGWIQGMKGTVMSSLGLDSPSRRGQTEGNRRELDAPQQVGTHSNLEGGKTEGASLSHEWSLDSASDVPQAAFL